MCCLISEKTRFYCIGNIVLEKQSILTKQIINFFSEEKNLDEKGIHDRDMIWLNESDCKF